MNNRTKVLILCTGNSARSQMGEGLLRHLASDEFEVESAGVAPSFVRPEAIEVMRELDIDITGQSSKSVDVFVGQHFDYVITVCDNAKQTCPVFPAARSIHWSLKDPAEVVGDQVTRLQAFREVRDQLRNLLGEFIKSIRG